MRLGPRRRPCCSARWPISSGTLVLQSPVLWTDDTPVTVLGGEEPGSVKGRFWAYIGDDAAPLQRLRLHHEPRPRRPGGVPGGLPRVPPGRRLRGL